MFQNCQMHQVVRERFPFAPGRCDVDTGKMPCLPFLEVSQLWTKLLQVPGVVEGVLTPRGKANLRRCSSPLSSSSPPLMVATNASTASEPTAAFGSSMVLESL